MVEINQGTNRYKVTVELSLDLLNVSVKRPNDVCGHDFDSAL